MLSRVDLLWCQGFAASLLLLLGLASPYQTEGYLVNNSLQGIFLLCDPLPSDNFFIVVRAERALVQL